MPAFTFEKITPPARRSTAPAAEKKPQRGRIVQLLDRFTEARSRRALRKQRPEADKSQQPSD